MREHALRALRDAIVSGELAPGQRLIEADLCASLGVSRPSVREALRQLEAEKLVRLTPYKGPTVAAIGWDDAAAIYETRALLEGHAAWLFAQRADTESLGSLRAALIGFESAARSGDARGRIESTAAFYEVILAGCGNPVIAEVLNGLLARINLLRLRSMSMHGRAAHSARELRAIYTALRRRDADAARDAAVDHVHRARAAAGQAFTGEPAASGAHPGRPRGPSRP